MSEQKVVVIKLVTGEEIIGMLGGSEFNVVTNSTIIEFPITTQLTQGGVGFSPFMPAAQTHEVVLHDRVILAGPLAAQPEMEEQYLKVLAEILADLEAKDQAVILPATKKFIV